MVYNQELVQSIGIEDERKTIIKEIKINMKNINKKLSQLSREQFKTINKYIWIEREGLRYINKKNSFYTWVDVVEVYSGIFNLFQKKAYLKWLPLDRMKNEDLSLLNEGKSYSSYKNHLSEMDIDSLRKLNMITYNLLHQI